MALELRYVASDPQLGEWHEELGDGEVAWFGRGEAHGPEHVCLTTQRGNPFMHRHVGVIRRVGALWVVQHVGERSRIRVEHRGAVTELLPAGGGIAPLIGESKIVVEFITGPKSKTTHVLEVTVDDEIDPPDPPPKGSGGTKTFAISLTPRERAILRLLCEPLASAAPGTTVAPTPYEGIADTLWIVPSDLVADVINKKIRSQFFVADPSVRGRNMAHHLAAAALRRDELAPRWTPVDRLVVALIAALCPDGHLRIPSPGTSFTVAGPDGPVSATIPEQVYRSVTPTATRKGWRRERHELAATPNGSMVRSDRGLRQLRTGEIAGLLATLVHRAGFEVPNPDVTPLLDDVLFNAVSTCEIDLIRAVYQESEFGPFLEAVAGLGPAVAPPK